MKTLKFNNGDDIPMIGLGSSGIPTDQTYDVIRKAIILGYRHFDCAPIYGNQKEIGDALIDAIDEGDVSREELFITSKLWNDSHRYNDVERSCEETLEELQLDYLDLYLIHWPVAHERGVIVPENEEEFLAEVEAPLEDTWVGMEDCEDAGLTKHIGVSNFNIANLQHLIDEGMVKPEVNQCEWHPYLPQQTLYDFCRSNKIIMTAYAPLGSPGRPAEMKNDHEPDLLTEPAIIEIAKKQGCTEAQALIAYALKRKMAVIPRATNPEHLKQNLEAENFTVDRADLRELIILPKFRYFKGEEYTIHGSPYKLTDIWEY